MPNPTTRGSGQQGVPGDKEQERRRRQGCQPKYITGPTPPNQGFDTSQVFISQMELDMNTLAVQLLMDNRNQHGHPWAVEICRKPPRHRSSRYEPVHMVQRAASETELHLCLPTLHRHPNKPRATPRSSPRTSSQVPPGSATIADRTHNTIRTDSGIRRPGKLQNEISNLSRPSHTSFISPISLSTFVSACSELHKNFRLSHKPIAKAVEESRRNLQQNTSSRHSRRSSTGRTSRGEGSRKHTGYDSAHAKRPICTVSQAPRHQQPQRESSPEWENLPKINKKGRRKRANKKANKIEIFFKKNFNYIPIPFNYITIPVYFDLFW